MNSYQLGGKAADLNLPGILNERPIGKQANVKYLSSKVDNRVGPGGWGMPLVIAGIGVGHGVVGERLRRAKSV
jgi:hypothetical protein